MGNHEPEPPSYAAPEFMIHRNSEIMFIVLDNQALNNLVQGCRLTNKVHKMLGIMSDTLLPYGVASINIRFTGKETESEAGE